MGTNGEISEYLEANSIGCMSTGYFEKETEGSGIPFPVVLWIENQHGFGKVGSKSMGDLSN